MSRAVTVDEYKNVWLDIGNTTYRVDDTERIEDVLANGDIVGRLVPRYAALYHDDVYVLLSVSSNDAIVAAFELDTIPTDISYETYSVNEHCRDRMVQRSITTGTIQSMLQNYVLFDRLQRRTYKLICRTDDGWHRAIVDTATQEIETVWSN